MDTIIFLVLLALLASGFTQKTALSLALFAASAVFIVGLFLYHASDKLAISL